MAQTPDSVAEPVPGTPGIREVRSDSGSNSFGFFPEVGGNPVSGIRKVSMRAEIDTSPPFGSVKEAVTRFGGSGSWMPLYKLGSLGIEDFDIKKVEEQAAELEKDLIVKELETLDVLEELGTTKRIVEELKRQLQKEALKCMTIPDSHPDEQMSTPAIKEMNKEHYKNLVHNHDQMVGGANPCPASSPDLILIELKQAKLNLGKTICDLGVIQTSVETLNKKMKKEKTLLEKTHERLATKFAGMSSLEEIKQKRVKSHMADDAEISCDFENSKNISRENLQLNSKAGQFKKMAEGAKSDFPKAMLVNEQDKTSMKTAELRLVAAKKMEEAARAAEAVALAEIKALSNSENASGFYLPEPEITFSCEKLSPLTSKAQKAEGLFKKKVVDAMLQKDEANITKLAILKKLEEATEEVMHSKQILEEVLNRIEFANRKQLAAEEALRKWMPTHDQEGQTVCNGTNLNNFRSPDYHRYSPLNDMTKPDLVNDDPKPVLRPTVSMRDILSRKQVRPEECVVRRQIEGHTERQKVALSQMLHELRGDLTFPTKTEKDDDQKHVFAQRRKFGFIHISLPLTKQSKKKTQALNTM